MSISGKDMPNLSIGYSCWLHLSMSFQKAASNLRHVGVDQLEAAQTVLMLAAGGQTFAKPLGQADHMCAKQLLLLVANLGLSFDQIGRGP